VIGRQHGDLGDLLEGMGDDPGGEPGLARIGLADHARIGDLAVQRHPQPIGRIVALQIGLARLRGPVRQGLGQFGLGGGDALVVRQQAVTAGQQRLAFVIERAQQLALPAVEDIRPDGTDVGDGQDQQQLQPFQALHLAGEVLDRLAVGEIARLRDGAHVEMVLDQPGDRIGFRLDRPRRGHSRRAMRAPAMEWSSGRPLAMSCSSIATKSTLRFCRVLIRSVAERMVVARLPALDLGEHADRADQVLVDRVVVVHVELHHRHDLAEVRHEAAEHADLVHLAQDGLRVAARGQHLTGTAGWPPVLAHRRVDQLQRAPHQLFQKFRMQHDRMPVGDGEHPNEIDRIGLEDAVTGGSAARFQ
jgi:hypothetical protein